MLQQNIFARMNVFLMWMFGHEWRTRLCLQNKKIVASQVLHFGHGHTWIHAEWERCMSPYIWINPYAVLWAGYSDCYWKLFFHSVNVSLCNKWFVDKLDITVHAMCRRNFSSVFSFQSVLLNQIQYYHSLCLLDKVTHMKFICTEPWTWHDIHN